MLIHDPATDPFQNLAAEEFLLREVTEPVLRLWRSGSCVVVGRHQIPCVEVNIIEAARRNVPVVRRLSGGGAVYHDLGNVNFTIIRPLERGEGIDFNRMLAPIVAALNQMGFAATHAGRGDVRLDGKKISGNAAYLWRGRILHHGTLLFDADLGALEALLDVPAGGAIWQAKSVQSIRSRVVNIRDAACAARFADAGAFADAFMMTLAPMLGEDAAGARAFTDAEKARIWEIALATYQTPEWNLGAAPDYALERPAWAGGPRLRLNVKGGRVAGVEIENDAAATAMLAKALVGRWHEPNWIGAALEGAKELFARVPSVDVFF
jgi:lipoate---protein ligase